MHQGSLVCGAYVRAGCPCLGCSQCCHRLSSDNRRACRMRACAPGCWALQGDWSPSTRSSPPPCRLCCTTLRHRSCSGGLRPCCRQRWAQQRSPPVTSLLSTCMRGQRPCQCQHCSAPLCVGHPSTGASEAGQDCGCECAKQSLGSPASRQCTQSLCPVRLARDMDAVY